MNPSPILPDLLAPNLSLVFCGTAAGTRSALEKAYYAHPGNAFYRILHETGLTSCRLAPAEYPRLLDFGIGLTDLAKATYGNDSDLHPSDFDREALADKIRHYAPKILAFTSKKAASVYFQKPEGRLSYGPQAESLGSTRLFVLPSTSGLARGAFVRNQQVWFDLAQELRSR